MKELTQTCTYWPPLGSPTQIKCLWFDSYVLLDVGVLVGGYLLLGESALPDPLMVEGTHRIIDYVATRNLREVTMRRVARLA